MGKMTIEYDLPEPYQKIIKKSKNEIAVAAERMIPIMQELGRNVMVFQGEGFVIQLRVRPKQ